MEFLKRTFKSTLLSLDMLIGFFAVTYSYQYYLEKGGDLWSSLLLIITSLCYFIFYPYFVIKFVDQDKMHAMARMYLQGIFLNQDKKDYEKNKKDDDTD